MREPDYTQLTLFAGDSPVSLSAMPGSEEAQKMTVTSGLKCLELSRNCGQLGYLERMLLASSIWASTARYLTWKARATKQGRLYFRLAPSKPRISENDVLLLPTPTASLGKHGGPNQRDSSGKPGLQMAAMIFPTPTAADVNHGINSSYGRGNPHLAKSVAMLPTPTTGAGLCGGTGNFQQLKNLEQSGVITEEERRNMSQGNGGKLNPEFVEWMMGFPPGWTEI